MDIASLLSGFMGAGLLSTLGILLILPIVGSIWAVYNAWRSNGKIFALVTLFLVALSFPVGWAIYYLIKRM